MQKLKNIRDKAKNDFVAKNRWYFYKEVRKIERRMLKRAKRCESSYKHLLYNQSFSQEEEILARNHISKLLTDKGYKVKGYQMSNLIEVVW